MKKCLVYLCLMLFSIVSCGDNSIPPGKTDTAATSPPPHTAPVTAVEIPRYHEAVGTIRPLTESVMESRMAAQILKVAVAPGDPVTRGHLLVELDSRSAKASLAKAREGEGAARNALNQALKAVDEARAGRDQARAELDRTQSLFDKQVVPSQKLDLDQAAFLQAKARTEQALRAVDVARSRLAQAGEAVKEAQIQLEYTRITAPADGVVIQRHVDPGDQALPGKPLLTLQTSGALRLEAQVREGLMKHIRKGQRYPVTIQTAQRRVEAVVEEVVPYADPRTRTFVVKAALPQTPGVYPGMFGRLRIPAGTRNTLVIPAEAVTRVGQLETVRVKTDTGFSRVHITTGKVLQSQIEILSGLTRADVVGW